MPELMTATIIREYGRDPFLILISCLLSLRTKDAVSLESSRRLFAVIRDPQQLVNIDISVLERLIYPVGFWRKKAHILKQVSRVILEEYHGTVPDNEEFLLRIKGIGPKTAALVLSEGFGIPAMVVDTHVHRVANRLGLVCTKKPEDTQKALQKLLPMDMWNQTHRTLVTWGQNRCKPRVLRCNCFICQGEHKDKK